MSGVDPRLLDLIREHYGTRYLKVLSCAQDVWDAVRASVPEAQPALPGMPDLAALLAIQVQVAPHYEPGRWKMTRHDACEVLGGDDTDMSMAVSHRECTVLGDSTQPQ